MTTTWQALRRVVGLTAVGVVAALGALAPATAGQDDQPATVTFESVDVLADMSVTYRVRILRKLEQRPATGAAVTMTATGPDGIVLPPVEFIEMDTAGGYVGTVHFPAAGTWQLQLAVDSPWVVVTRAQVVELIAPTTTSEPNTSTTPAAINAPTTTAPPLRLGTDTPPAKPSSIGTVIFIVSIVVVVGGFAIVLARGRRAQ